MIDDKGTILAHPDSQLLDKDLSSLFEGPLPALDAPLQAARSKGQDVVVRFLPVTGLPSVKWHVGVVLDADKTYARLHEFRNNAIWGVILILIATLVVLGFTLSILTRPIRHMQQAMNNIAQGDGEVRALASKTRDSTQVIQSTLGRLQEGSRRAVSAMQSSRTRGESSVARANEAGEGLEAIAQAVGTINAMNTQIAAAAEEQTAVTEDITRSITTIAESAELSLTAAREAATVGNELGQVALALRNEIRRFKI